MDLGIKKLIEVEGQKISLNDIEHRILRPIWQDHRIHYAVNCASLSCPNLYHQAYTAENIETILAFSENAYIKSDRGARLESGNKLILSSIFDWYQSDFGENEDALLLYLTPFFPEHIQQAIENNSSIKIDYEYDWSLNSTQ